MPGFKARGFDGSAITDHNSIANIREARREFSRNGLELVPGMEITTEAGHLIGLFVEDAVRPNTQLEEALDRIKSLGGISIIPHPFDVYRKGIGTAALKARFDCMEAFNGRSIFRGRDRLAGRYFKDSTLVASSDAHTLREIGSAWTKIGGHDVYKALKKGRTEVHCKYSPFSVHIKSVFNRAENFFGTPFDTRRILSSI